MQHTEMTLDKRSRPMTDHPFKERELLTSPKKLIDNKEDCPELYSKDTLDKAVYDALCEIEKKAAKVPLIGHFIIGCVKSRRKKKKEQAKAVYPQSSKEASDGSDK